MKTRTSSLIAALALGLTFSSLGNAAAYMTLGTVRGSTQSTAQIKTVDGLKVEQSVIEEHSQKPKEIVVVGSKPNKDPQMWTWHEAARMGEMGAARRSASTQPFNPKEIAVAKSVPWQAATDGGNGRVKKIGSLKTEKMLEVQGWDPKKKAKVTSQR